ncbi:unnamed protein product [Eruca vesicaria subsp. sativa]|uniref:Uncharacterized protein n=1 Tax=Eruca vesicaria subsp. sativa TaxID=29727 RepID=A0ABC8IZM0_ERUVS|nr:unnamed protein product [Eruca vesicaria subsp. sativa]
MVSLGSPKSVFAVVLKLSTFGSHIKLSHRKLIAIYSSKIHEDFPLVLNADEVKSVTMLNTKVFTSDGFTHLQSKTSEWLKKNSPLKLGCLGLGSLFWSLDKGSDPHRVRPIPKLNLAIGLLIVTICGPCSVRPTSLSGPRIEEPTNIIFLDAGEVSCRRRRVLCSASCYSSSLARSPPYLTCFRRLCLCFGVWDSRSVTFWGLPHLFIMTVSFSHLQTSRSTPLPQCRPPSPPFLYSQTSPSRYSSTNADGDGPLRDSEEIFCAASLLCRFVGPIFSGDPSSPLPVHRPSLDSCVSIAAAGVSISEVFILSFPSLNQLSWVGSRMITTWAWTAKLHCWDSPHTNYTKQGDTDFWWVH